jgi:hypothetical protein
MRARTRCFCFTSNSIRPVFTSEKALPIASPITIGPVITAAAAAATPTPV